MQLGALEYLITLNSSSLDKDIKKADNKLTAWAVAKGQMINHALEKAMSTAGNLKKVIGGAFSSFADYEQLVGGVETLFKDTAVQVKKFAEQAYKTAGISANEYMETVTSFSASLLQSLKGDTDKAADYADMAIRDMADNANKMGSSMQSIQNAYQGFAKQNYTMLDNLKLGYGGTKTEMQRLLSDAGKLVNRKFDIKNLSDVYEAIHIIQQEMGIFGTTKKEAEETIAGSMNSAKAAWKDLLTAMGSGKNVPGATKRFVESAQTVIKNATPVIQRTINSLLISAKTMWPSVKKAVSDIWKSAISTIKGMMPKSVRQLMNIGGTIIKRLTQAFKKDGLKGIGNELKNIGSKFKISLAEWLELGEDSSWKDIGSKLAQKIKKGFGQTKLTIASLLGLTDEKGNPLTADNVSWLKIGQGIADKLTEALQDGGWLDQALTNWTDKMGAIASFAGKLIGGIAEWVSNNSGDIVKIVESFISSFATAAPKIIESITALIGNPEFINSVSMLIATIIQTIKDNGPALVKAATDIAQTAAKSIDNILRVPEGTTETAAEAFIGFKAFKLGQKVIGNVKQAITAGKNIIGKVKNGFNILSGGTGTADLLDDASNAASQVVTEAGKEVTKHSGKIAEFFTNAKNAIGNKIAEIATSFDPMSFFNSTVAGQGFFAYTELGQSISNSLSRLITGQDQYAGVGGVGDFLSRWWEDTKKNASTFGDWWQKSLSECSDAMKQLTDSYQAYASSHPIFQEIILHYSTAGGIVPGTGAWSVNGSSVNAITGLTGGSTQWIKMKKAKGDWNVPHDMIATLHRGEMVLTKSQARRYRDEGNIDSEVLVNAIQELGRDIKRMKMYVGKDAFGQVVTDTSGGRMSRYIAGKQHSKLAAMGAL